VELVNKLRDKQQTTNKLFEYMKSIPARNEHLWMIPVLQSTIDRHVIFSFKYAYMQH